MSQYYVGCALANLSSSPANHHLIVEQGGTYAHPNMFSTIPFITLFLKDFFDIAMCIFYPNRTRLITINSYSLPYLVQVFAIV